MSRLAIDVGGANLKAADGRGYAGVQPFALWREPSGLADQVRAMIRAAPRCEGLVVTMTGELCDCFATKAEGVGAIIDAIEAASGGRSVQAYLTDGRLASADEARQSHHLAAASNWHALAAFAARFSEGRTGVLIDVGSTTADLIPLVNGIPATASRTDADRLIAGELIYTGVERTPIAAILSHLPWRGRHCPVASELFATTADAYLTLGDLLEEIDSADTADGRARTVEMARGRLARMICADATTFDGEDARKAALAIRDRQLWMLEAGLGQVISRMPKQPEVVILSGHGEFLAQQAVERFVRAGRMPEIVSLSSLLGSQVSRVAPAHALAVLANERPSA